MPWERMDVVLPPGESPEKTFAMIQEAAFDRDWKKFYGCLTDDARCEQITTLANDVAFLACRAMFALDGTPDRFAITSPEKLVQRCKVCLDVFDKHGLDPKNTTLKFAPSVSNLDQFVADAWDAIADPGTTMFEKNTTIAAAQIIGDDAIAEVHGNHNRHQNWEPDFIRFRRVNDRWLIDMAPWWIPWGPSYSKHPLKKVREIPHRSRNKWWRQESLSFDKSNTSTEMVRMTFQTGPSEQLVQLNMIGNEAGRIRVLF